MKVAKAQSLYQKLKNFWGVSRYGYTWPMGVRSAKRGDNYYACIWQPELEKRDFFRPTFTDFLSMYQIKLKGVI